MKNKIGIIIAREYAERVSKKSFIITTILMPVLMLLLMVAPALIMSYTSPEAKTIGVIDRTGQIFPLLESSENIKLVNSDLPVDSVTAGNMNGECSGYLVIADNAILNPGTTAIRLYVDGPTTMELEQYLTNEVGHAIETVRLKSYDINNLQEILDNVQANVTLVTQRTDKAEGEETISGTISFAIGLVMAFVLYMFLIMYGQMVMTSIIEEKNNRVLELVVTSVRPFQLMMGKILGVGLVAVTQVLIWGVLLLLMAVFVVPMVMPEAAMADMASFQAGTLDTGADDYEIISAFASVTNVNFIIQMLVYTTIFLLGGFLLYASIFAAIGSAVDNVQDASQLTSFAMIPIILALVCSTSIANAPMSPMATWLSIIPFTSPMVMMTRIPFGIPTWEIVVSIIVLFASFALLVWFAGKIYRVGIFMYGKKPTIKDLIRWARYK